MVRRLAVLSLFVSVLGGCSSLPDLHFDDADGGGAEGGPRGPCTPTGAEICDDGIDNDCNGKTDCEDPACNAGFTCVEAAPSDWTIVALAESARTSCPTGYGAGTDVRSISASAAASAPCTCNCSGAAACESAGFKLALGTSASCGGDMVSPSVKSTCQKLNGNGVDVPVNAFVKATAGATPTCGANPTSAPVALDDGRTCAAARVGTGCPGSQVCVPKVKTDYQVCITKPGANACPGTFPSARRAGTSANDTRTCGACTCTATPCSGEMKLFSDNMCSSAEVVTVGVTPPPGACTQMTNGALTARGCLTTVTGGCVAGAPPPLSGTLTFASESTICCANPQ